MAYHSDPMPDPATLLTSTDPQHRKPSRLWYALSTAILLISLGVFVAAIASKAAAVRERIEAMPRFVGPSVGGSVVELTEPGQYIVFHENQGSYDGKAYDTPRRQVWPTFASPSMTCTIVSESDGKPIEPRLPGVDNPVKDKREVNTDLVPAYDTAGRQGHGVWVFNIDQPGAYRVTLVYVPEVAMSVEDVQIPPVLTRDMQSGMTSEQGKAYEQQRRDAEEALELARLEPVDVLFAVGQDPSRGSYFNLIGIKGAATVFAFGFTASVIIALVTLMLRGGHVTPRGELSKAQRGLMGSAKNQSED